MFDFWIRESDNRRLEFAYNTDMRPYAESYLTGEIDKIVSLKKIMEYFTVASWMLWVPQETGKEYDFAYVESATLYPRGVVLTPFKAKDTQLDHHSQWIHRKERIEMEGSDNDDFPTRFFRNYTGSFKAQQVKDWRAFLYRSGVRTFNVGIPGSFPVEELDGMLRDEGILRGEGVRGSKYVGIISVKERRLQFSNWAHHVDGSRQKLPGFIADFVEKKKS